MIVMMSLKGDYEMIKITYYGHSCFTVDCDGYKIAFDPYDGHVPGYAPLSIAANEVLCSHEHADHNYVQAVTLESAGATRPFTLTEIHSFHDPEEGKLRGTNIIRILEADSLRIAHFGDIGCHPTLKQMELLGNLDVAMVPVGGTFTLDAKQQKSLMDELRPRVIIPMHYRLGKFGFDVIAELSDFTKLYSNVNNVGIQSLVIDKSLSGVYVLNFE